MNVNEELKRVRKIIGRVILMNLLGVLNDYEYELILIIYKEWEKELKNLEII